MRSSAIAQIGAGVRDDRSRRMNKGDRYADRFTILSLAGSGGTASVFRAFDDETQTIVALKVFATEGVEPDVVGEIWNRETKALTALRQDAVATFLGAGRDQETGQRYIILEWIDGVSLEKHLEAIGKLTWEGFYSALGKPLLDALVHASERDISHRDLSTSNVIVTSSGAIKIIDFGQAKISNIPLGRTVAGWRTAPYCPPEEDTGTHTHTRDPFSFCAIAVRAISGHALADHEALYRAFDQIVLAEAIREVFQRALNRDPRARYVNSIELQSALHGQFSERLADVELVVPIRLAPIVVDRVQPTAEDEGLSSSALDLVIQDLNSAVGVAQARVEGEKLGTRLELETQSYRMIADIDSQTADHLVVVGLVPKRFRLDALYQSERWMPRLRFTPFSPQRAEQRAASRGVLRELYQGLEEFQASAAKVRRQAGPAAIAEWGRLLEALRFVARHEMPALRYSKLESEGAWLTATVDNPEDAAEAQIRTISVASRWVFRGEIDSVVGNQCSLVSTRPRIDLEAIPPKGVLEIDWQQTKIALDRQARSLERFKSGDLPNPRLGRLVTGEERGPDEPTFFSITSFFDTSLDADKKAIVARCSSGIDLLVTHGPPGTGKTKLIVELVRQTLRTAPDSKILLVSQTHAALDNALERLLKFEPNVSCVRIGSGSKESDPRVEKCTVESRGKALRSEVEAASQKYIVNRAKSLGVDHAEVELGLRALDVISLREVIADRRRNAADLELEVERLTRETQGEGTSERSSRRLRLEAIEDTLDRLNSQIQVSEAELGVAAEKLAALGRQGRDLAQSTEDELRQWADVLIEGEERRSLGELMKLSEQWRLRFGQSDDFKAAIIASSSVVAGTCVGFCREEAASRTAFDLCIIDEAGKATTTELLVPLAQSRRAVIVGDHHQLPAVIDHAVQTPELMDRFGVTPDQIRVQLFETLTTAASAACRAALAVQYRMRGAIGALISTCFYEGQLQTDESANHRKVVDLSLAGLNGAVTWIDPYVGAGEKRFEQQDRTSYASAREVQCIVSLLRRLAFVFEHSVKSGPWPSVAVITGYASQANQLRAEIRRDTELDKLRVESATVHSFQGREVDICIYSVARRNRDFRIGMLTDWRHLNVALSRARDYLVIVGGIEFCRNVPDPNPFRAIVEFFDSSTECDVKEWPDD
jgi:tRNA A-37 threonylcarbamoyl transferase component Bud32